MNTRILCSFLMLFSARAFAQCDVLVSNFPHGDCEGTDIELFAAPTGNFNTVTYQWSGPNGFTSTAPYVYIAQASAACSGTYQVTITTDLGCSATREVTVIKHPSPQVSTQGTGTGCLNTASMLQALDMAGSHGPYSYSWSTGQTTAQIEIVHNGGSYPAPACAVTNSYGCAASNTTTFMVSTYPQPDPVTIQEAGATTFCEGKSVSLGSDADSSLDLQWKRYSKDIGWRGDGPVYKATKSGTYRLVATNATGCTVMSNAISVNVMPKPEAFVTNTGSSTICTGDSTLLKANSGAGYIYQWKRYGNELAGASADSFYARKTGNYRVVVTNTFGCRKESVSEKIYVGCRETGPRENSMTLSVYPNPSADAFRLEGATDSPVEIMITDLTGRVVEVQAQVILPVRVGSELNNGIYMITVRSGSRSWSKKLIKTQIFPG